MQTRQVAALLSMGLLFELVGSVRLLPGATALAAPVTNSGQRTLDFLDVFPGLNSSVAITDATSGKWYVTGDPSESLTLTFTGLPSTLDKAPDTIPITYSGTDAAYNTTDDPGTATTFDPASGTVATTSPSGELWVWIGGTVAPPETAVAGAYSATITLDAVR